MLKVTDIRIGNFLKWKTFGGSGISVVCFIENRPQEKTPFISPLFQLESGANSIECQPIELDESWLMKFGFVKAEDVKYINSDIEDFVLIKHNDRFIFDGWGAFSVEYVHQLQNIFHAITGKELFMSD